MSDELLFNVEKEVSDIAGDIGISLRERIEIPKLFISAQKAFNETTNSPTH